MAKTLPTRGVLREIAIKKAAGIPLTKKDKDVLLKEKQKVAKKKAKIAKPKGELPKKVIRAGRRALGTAAKKVQSTRAGKLAKKIIKKSNNLNGMGIAPSPKRKKLPKKTIKSKSKK